MNTKRTSAAAARIPPALVPFVYFKTQNRTEPIAGRAQDSTARRCATCPPTTSCSSSRRVKFLLRPTSRPEASAFEAGLWVFSMVSIDSNPSVTAPPSACAASPAPRQKWSDRNTPFHHLIYSFCWLRYDVELYLYVKSCTAIVSFTKTSTLNFLYSKRDRATRVPSHVVVF